MKTPLLILSFFFVLVLATAVAARSHFAEDPKLHGLIGSAIGIALSVFLGSRIMNRNPVRQTVARWVDVILISLGGPLLLFGVVSIFLSLFSVRIRVEPVVFLSIYAFALPFSFWFSIYRLDNPGEIATPLPDERLRSHYAWSATASFVFLNVLILAALVQPWIAIGTVWLWVSVLAAGFIFWVAGVVTLDLKR